MITHRNFLKVWIVVFMFCSSLQASDNNPPTPNPSYWDWFNIFSFKVRNDGTFHKATKIKTDEGKEEIHSSASGVVIKTVIALTVWKLADPVLDQALPVIVSYLPDAWPCGGIKESYKLKREKEAEDKMLAEHEREKRMDEFKKDTGLTDEQISEFMKKSLKN